MTNIYLETSAALRDLLDGDARDVVRNEIARAATVATSRLTIAEVGRVLARLRVLEPSVAKTVAPREATWLDETDIWIIHPVDDAVLTRCARPFPAEPVRALDAIHLATIEKLAEVLDSLVVLATDERVRRNARALGFEVRP